MGNLAKLIQKLEVNCSTPENAASGNPVVEFLSQAMVIIVKWLIKM